MERRTGASAVSFSRGEYPTPAATDWKGSAEHGQRRGQLSEAAETSRPDPVTPTDGALFSVDGPTSRLLYPTPSATDAKAGGSRNTETSAAHDGVSLTDFVQTGDSTGRSKATTRKRLNPFFVAWLMGLPPFWALPLDAMRFAALVTESFRSKPPKPSDCSPSERLRSDPDET